MQPSHEPKVWKLLRNLLSWYVIEICERFFDVQINKFSQFKFTPHRFLPVKRKEAAQLQLTAFRFPCSLAKVQKQTEKFRLNTVRTDADGTADHSVRAQHPELWEHWEGFWSLLHSQLNPNRDGRSVQETEKTEGRARLTCMQSSHFC